MGPSWVNHNFRMGDACVAPTRQSLALVRSRRHPPRPPPILCRLERPQGGRPPHPTRRPDHPAPLSRHGHGLGPPSDGRLGADAPPRGRPGGTISPRGGGQSPVGRRHGSHPPYGARSESPRKRIGTIDSTPRPRGFSPHRLGVSPPSPADGHAFGKSRKNRGPSTFSRAPRPHEHAHANVGD